MDLEERGVMLFFKLIPVSIRSSDLRVVQVLRQRAGKMVSATSKTDATVSIASYEFHPAQ